MKINLAHVFGAAATVGLGHYGLTGLEDAGASLHLAANALIGATALTGLVVAHEKIANQFQKSDLPNHENNGPDAPGH
tara:strand:+ start:1356 stop:1589 length:234 start_codon:yes stop_codon:yes gene_type:complete